jgi:hypothetical protein
MNVTDARGTIRLKSSLNAYDTLKDGKSFTLHVSPPTERSSHCRMSCN